MQLYLAPIQGMTIAHYRKLYADVFGGIDKYYAPFIDTSSMRNPKATIFNDLITDNAAYFDAHVPQLLSNNGVDFRYYASVITALGYKEVNWNIGCPFPRVTKKKKGSGILPQVAMIERFLDEVCLDNNYKLTIKMRLGFSSLNEGHEVIKLLNDYPIDGIILHGRTGLQRYTGTVDLDAFEELYAASKHKIIYNGDIFTLEDFLTISKRFPSLTDFMIGRGALRNPFLAAEIKGKHFAPEDKFNKIKTYHDSVYDHYRHEFTDNTKLIGRMKEFWSYAAVQVESDPDFLAKIRKCHTLAEYNAIVVPYLSYAMPT